MHIACMNDGHTILIVEDENLIALEIELGLEAEGYDVLGPVANVENGLQLIQHFDIDAAILDVDLGGGNNSFPLAYALLERNIPILFYTGRVPYEAISDKFADAVVLTKPTYLPKMITHLQKLTPEMTQAR